LSLTNRSYAEVRRSIRCVCGRPKKINAYACYRCKHLLPDGIRKVLQAPDDEATADTYMARAIEILKTFKGVIDNVEEYKDQPVD
jgi:hypothetical protein